MASTPEQALDDWTRASCDTKELRLRDVIHLPCVMYTPNRVVIWQEEADVPEYQELVGPLAGSTCVLKAYDLIGSNPVKCIYRATYDRFRPDGTAIWRDVVTLLTVLNKDGDWRIVINDGLGWHPPELMAELAAARDSD
jgi:hypothetical protein